MSNKAVVAWTGGRRTPVIVVAIPKRSIGTQEAETPMMSSRIFSPLTLAAAISMITLGAYAADTASDTKAKKPAEKEQASAGSEKPTLKAMLVEPEKKAKEKAATVKVTVGGVKIIDPATVNEKAAAGQGHIHYKLDDGPVVATTAAKLSWHELSSGKHKITVMLAGNDHQPLGPEETVSVDIP
jgi:hypothetical protein